MGHVAFTLTFTFISHLGKTHNHRSRGDTPWRAQAKSMRALIMFASHHRLADSRSGSPPAPGQAQVPLVLAPGGHTHNSNLNHISTCSDRSVPESGLCCSLVSASPCRSYSTPIISRAI